jgi:hypothetical protein
MAKKVKVKGHTRSDGVKVKGHTRKVTRRRHPHTEMSESRSKRVGRQIKRGLTRLMRKARAK